MKVRASVAAAAVLLGALSGARAASVSEVVVYIECTGPQGQLVRGTGVLVSAQGHVLTAKHVAPQDYSCKGAIGNASLPLRGMIRDPRQADIDAMLLRFTPGPGDQFAWLKYCRLDEVPQGKGIVVTGFPGASATGQPSIRKGDLSTTVIDQNGIVESTALTTSGMSGGPVTLEGGTNLIGIIAGATFDSSTGAPSSYGVLAAYIMAKDLGLAAAEDCMSPRADSDGASDSGASNKSIVIKGNVNQRPTGGDAIIGNQVQTK